MKKNIIEYYCDLCESQIITAEKEELPRVRVQGVEEATTVISGEKRTYLRNLDIHMCEGCMEAYMNRLPLKFGANNKVVWRDNPK